MNIDYVIHDASGRILRYGDCQEETLDYQHKETGETILVGTGTFNDYVDIDSGTILSRPENPCNLNGSTLTDVPMPCTVQINGVDYEVDDEDNTLELDFTNPGVYKVVIKVFPYLDKEIEISI